MLDIRNQISIVYLEEIMRLTPPKKWVFWTSVFLVVLGIVGRFVSPLLFVGYAFWVVVVGYVLLAAGNFFKGF